MNLYLFNNNMYKHFFKRLFDIIGALILLPFVLLEIIVLAPIIWLTDKGPVFYNAKRAGKGYKPFKMFKLRSMYVNSPDLKNPDGSTFNSDNDPRVTPIGRIIRKTSLDEFPQFLNILKGDMSLIGTRPPTVDEFLRYEDHHKRRLSMKPGLTGLWQVSGRSEITDFEDVVRLDCEYIDNWSLALDLKIFLKTIAVVFQRKGSG